MRGIVVLKNIHKPEGVVSGLSYMKIIPLRNLSSFTRYHRRGASLGQDFEGSLSAEQLHACTTQEAILSKTFVDAFTYLSQKYRSMYGALLGQFWL